VFLSFVPCVKKEDISGCEADLTPEDSCGSAVRNSIERAEAPKNAEDDICLESILQRTAVG
jgi:hypothetical protein